MAHLLVIFSTLTNLGSVYLDYILYFVLHDLCVVCCGIYIANFTLLICNLKLLTATNATKYSKKETISMHTYRRKYTNSQRPIEQRKENIRRIILLPFAFILFLSEKKRLSSFSVLIFFFVFCDSFFFHSSLTVFHPVYSYCVSHHNHTNC